MMGMDHRALGTAKGLALEDRIIIKLRSPCPLELQGLRTAQPFLNWKVLGAMLVELLQGSAEACSSYFQGRTLSQSPCCLDATVDQVFVMAFYASYLARVGRGCTSAMGAFNG